MLNMQELSENELDIVSGGMSAQVYAYELYLRGGAEPLPQGSLFASNAWLRVEGVHGFVGVGHTFYSVPWTVAKADRFQDRLGI